MRPATVLAFLLMATSIPMAVVSAQDAEPVAQVPRSIAKLLSRYDGQAAATAYKVRNVRQEYQILAAIGMSPERQRLVMQGGTFDVITAVHPQTGARRDIWFRISSF